MAPDPGGRQPSGCRNTNGKGCCHAVHDDGLEPRSIDTQIIQWNDPKIKRCWPSQILPIPTREFPQTCMLYWGGSRRGEGAVIDRNAHKDEEPDYLSYLLRLWCVEGDRGRVWRASLQSTQTRQQVGFAGLEALFEYLRAETSIEVTPDLRGRANARPRPPRSTKSMNGKGGADASGVEPDLPDP